MNAQIEEICEILGMAEVQILMSLGFWYLLEKARLMVFGPPAFSWKCIQFLLVLLDYLFIYFFSVSTQRKRKLSQDDSGDGKSYQCVLGY